jgi:hypothetical protein
MINGHLFNHYDNFMLNHLGFAKIIKKLGYNWLILDEITYNNKKYELDIEISRLKQEKADKEIILNKEKLLHEINTIYQTFILIKLGLYTWTLELFIKNEIEENNAKEFLNEIDFAFNDIKDMIEILISIQDNYKFDDFGWQDWLLPTGTMLENKMYMVPSVSNWLFLGVVFRLFDFSFLIRLRNVNLKSIVDTEKSVYIYDLIKSSLKTLSNNYQSKLEKILNPSIENFEESKYIIDEFFIKLKTRYEHNRKTEITNSEINIENIKLLEEDLNKQFNDTKNLFSLFEHFNNIELKEKNKVLKKIEHHLYIKNYKEYLINNPDGFRFHFKLGNFLNDVFDNLVIKFLKENTDTQPYNQNNILDEIDRTINTIKTNHFSPNVILIDSKVVFSNFAVINKVLDEHKKYSVNNKELPNFKDCIFIKLNNELIRNKIIILDFEQSLKLILDKTQEDEIIDIKVEYSEEKIIVQNQDDFEFTQTELEQIEKINTVGIKVKKYIDFEELNNDAFIVLDLIQEQS